MSKSSCRKNDRYNYNWKKLAIPAGIALACYVYVYRMNCSKSIGISKHSYPSHNYSKDIERVLFSAQEIESKIEQIAKQISIDYQDKPLILVGLMRGCYHVLSDISRHLSIPHEIDIIGLTTYEGQRSTHSINLYHHLNLDIANKHVLIVDDLVDTAFTLNWLATDYFVNTATGHKSLRFCCLLDKKEAIKVDGYVSNVKPLLTYVGFPVENVFLVGYGMDYEQHYRSLPFIGVLKKSAYGIK